MDISIFHVASYPWQYVDDDNVLCLQVKATGHDIRSITCLACDPCDTKKGSYGEDIPQLYEIAMQRRFDTATETYFSLRVLLKTHKLRYHFLIHTAHDTLIYDENGLSQPKEELHIRPFFVPFTYPEEIYVAPNWCKGMVWYQIFPDRFASENPIGEKWKTGRVSDRNLFSGGTIKGILSKIPYLKKLGVKGLYLNPIFEAKSTHRYDTVDYYTIDPKLGTEEDFIKLCDCCHENGIRIMLDGVFNHCSSSSAQFRDVLKLGTASQYYDWFFINDSQRLINYQVPDGVDPEFRNSPLYETFAFVPSMPKFNTSNPQVMNHLIGAAEYWTKKCKIDAWRLDVPDEISMTFLREFRTRMKRLNSNIYIIGEIWGDATSWLRENLFSGTMNYPVYFIIRDFIGYQTITAPKCAQLLIRRLASYPEATQSGMFNFCSTHDTPRILWHCHENKKLAGLCYILTTAVGESFSIYYGDEVGMTGGYDPDNRRCYPWGNENPENEMGTAIQFAIRLLRRKATEKIVNIFAVDEDVLCLQYVSFACYINRSEKEKAVCGIIIPPYGSCVG